MRNGASKAAASAAALVSLLAILGAVAGCSACIGVVEWGDPGEGMPVEFPAAPASTSVVSSVSIPESTP